MKIYDYHGNLSGSLTVVVEAFSYVVYRVKYIHYASTTTVKLPLKYIFNAEFSPGKCLVPLSSSGRHFRRRGGQSARSLHHHPALPIQLSAVRSGH